MMKLLMCVIGPLLAVMCLGCSDSHAGMFRSDDHVAASNPVLALAGRVTDAANVLTVAEEAQLSAKLTALERTTGHQMVVVTVSTLGGRDIGPFTTDLANSWGVGRREHNDGVVLLIAPNERKARIAVGYGLEKTLPDAFCSHVMNQEIIPPFSRGDLVGGINAGVVALIRKLN